MNDNKIMWFFDEDSYKQLGEKIMKMVDLLLPYENYVKVGEYYTTSNYTPSTIFERIQDIQIHFDNQDGEFGTNYAEIEDSKHERRMIILQDKLLEVFLSELYPEFEYELRYFVTKTRNWLLPDLCARYLDQMIIHHHHYFPNMEPLGMAHQSCNLKTYMKGVPKPHIYVHNLTNYDSNFILKMIPYYIMAHKGKNTESQWSVIAPPGNKNKIKLMMTPFGIFSDSINFFNNSLADMADNMAEEDVKQLYDLHFKYFSTHPRFKTVMKKRENRNPSPSTASK